MPMDYLKKEALRVRQMYRFRRPDGTEYQSNTRAHYRDEQIEDLSDRDISCEDLGMRKGQIWRRRNDQIYSEKIRKNNPNLGEYSYSIVTEFDNDNWVYLEAYNIEERALEPAYQSQAMERQSSYINHGYELYEGELFKENL